MDATVIFTEHGATLEGLAARITRDREEARDVVADAFAALLASGPTDADHAVAWLYVTVRNNAYNRVRRQAMAKRRLAALAADSDPSSEPESAVRCDPSVRVLISTATAHLNERDRIAVSMRHVEQASYADIAAALGTTVMQARVVVHRANGKLRKHVVASLSKHRPPERAGSFVDTAARQGRVSEELAALLQVPALLPCSKRVGHALREVWHRLEATGGRAVLQLGELVAPGMALVAMATTTVAPLDLPPARPSLLSASTAGLAGEDVAPSGPQPMARRLPAVPDSSGDASPAPPSVNVAPTATQPLRFEDPGPPTRTEHFFDAERRSILGILGLPFGGIDPLELSVPEIDIQSFELATMGDARGRPQALRWRIALAAPPTRALSYITLQWWYEGSDCFTVFEWPAEVDAHVLTPCPVVPVVGGMEGDKPHGYAAYEYSRGKLRLDGSVLEVTLPFASLDQVTRKFLRPGARLVRIVVMATCPDRGVPTLDRCPSDRAPDEGGYTYRIET
jgi:RNA polymerase sigma factor (sigma-70 family)